PKNVDNKERTIRWRVYEVKSITVKELINRFQLEVITGENELDKKIYTSKTRRPGIEFIDTFNFLPEHHVHVLGEDEIEYLHTLSEDERDVRVGNLITYEPPCIIVTDNQEGLTYLRKYCVENNIPLLRTSDTNYEYIGKIDAYMNKRMADESAIHGVCVNVFGTGVLDRKSTRLNSSHDSRSYAVFCM